MCWSPQQRSDVMHMAAELLTPKGDFSVVIRGPLMRHQSRLDDRAALFLGWHNLQNGPHVASDEACCVMKLVVRK